ncbi:preprotein translocase subunit SecY, partial [Candidatus Bathyarchaeota archaeon]
IVTAGLVLQLLAASRLIECDFTNPEDRALFTAANKFLSLVLTAVNALAYIIGGFYAGAELDFVTSTVVFVQLLVAGLILILLDEMVQKGWGFGSGISLFILAGVAQNVLWDTFNPMKVGDDLSHGALIATVQAVKDRNWEALYNRKGYPTLVGLLATVAVFLVVIYMQGMRVEIPISYARVRGYRGRYPISLLYISNIPVIFSSALFANIYFFSQILWRKYNQGHQIFWLDLLGWFEESDGNVRPAGGLVYYLAAPRGVAEVMENPLRAVIYLIIMVVACGLFARLWLEVGGLDPETVARQLVDSGMQIPGFRRSYQAVKRLLQRYIPTVTILGGILVGLLAALSDFLGVFGTGTGILLAVGIVYQYYQILVRERIEELHPGLAKLLGA